MIDLIFLLIPVFIIMVLAGLIGSKLDRRKRLSASISEFLRNMDRRS